MKIVDPNRAATHAPERIVFTRPYEDPSASIPPGGSRVTITPQQVANGTVVRHLQSHGILGVVIAPRLRA